MRNGSTSSTGGSTRLERDVGISVETLAVFVRFWLTTTPPLPDTAQAAARAKAGSDTRASSQRSAADSREGRKLRKEVSRTSTRMHLRPT